jgi:hypothetical protein
MVKLIKINNPHGTKVENLSEVYINPEHVSYLVEDEQMTNLASQGFIFEGLDPNHRFTRVVVDTGRNTEHFTVIGGVSEIANKLKNSKQLLRG